MQILIHKFRARGGRGPKCKSPGSIDAEVEDAFSFNARGKRLGIKQSLWLQNLLGEKAVFLLKRRH